MPVNDDAFRRDLRDLRGSLAAAKAEVTPVPSWRDAPGRHVLVRDTVLSGRKGLVIAGGSLATIAGLGGRDVRAESLSGPSVCRPGSSAHGNTDLRLSVRTRGCVSAEGALMGSNSQRNGKVQVNKTERVGSGSDNSKQVTRSAVGGKSTTVHRSATTGRFVSSAAASRHPGSTIEARNFSPTNVSAIPDHDIREAFSALLADDSASIAFPQVDTWRFMTRVNEALLNSFKVFVDNVRLSGVDEERASSILLESAELLQTPERPASVLTAAQADFAVRSGAMTAEEFAEAEAMVASGELDELERKTRLEAVTEALSTAEVAAKLGRDESRVRDRAGKGQLYSFLVGGKRLFPKWQFTDDAKQEILPGLSVLVKGIPDDMHASTVLNFMATPQRSLLIDDERVTPTEWMRLGRPPQDVVDILDGFLQS